MKKAKVSKKVQDAIIKEMAKNQNAKKKLNAGQLREAQALVLNAILSLPSSIKFDLGVALLKQVDSVQSIEVQKA